MPRKNAMRDNVSAVRSQLPHLSNLSREKIELALLYYELNVDETVEAFKRNGAIEALSGWTEMSNGRGHNSSKRGNNKSTHRNKTSFSQTPPSNGILRPSQRVSNIFQTFAEGGIPTITTNENMSISNAEISFHEQSNKTTNNDVQTYSSTDLSFHPCFSQESTQDELHDTSNAITNSSTTVEEFNLVTNCIVHNTNEINGHNDKIISRYDRTSSTSLNHEQIQSSDMNDIQQSTNNNSMASPTTKAMIKSSSAIFSNNRKILAKPSKDLQRQTSTLANVELSFENEIKSSIKQIDEIFKQIREIIKEREIDLYLEIDKVKEQGLNIIHRRQQRAVGLRQRLDHCDCLEPLEIDHLRTDIKQFASDRRYDLCEELTSSHRFQYDQTLVDALKNFGTVLRIDRKYDRARTLSTSSTLADQNRAITENTSISLTNTTTSNEILSSDNQQALSQRNQHQQNFNSNNNYDENCHVSPQINGSYQYSTNHRPINRRRSQRQKYSEQSNEDFRRLNPKSSSNNQRHKGSNNSETNKYIPSSSIILASNSSSDQLLRQK